MKYIFILLISVIMLIPPAVFSSSNRDSGSVQGGEGGIENPTAEPGTDEDPASIIETKRTQKEEEKKKKEEKKAEETKKPEGGIITGTLRDESGQPIPGATITCSNEAGVVVAKEVTDSEGRYEFSDLSAGTYTLNAFYSGFPPPLEIKFKGEEVVRPPIPTGIRAFEIDRGYVNDSVIRVLWDPMPNTTDYTCELYIRNEPEPVMKYPAMKQNFCEFGNIRENTDYQVRVYSKNSGGYSSSYALATVRTKNRPPSPPFGLGVTSAINNRVNLIFNGSDSPDVTGYILQVRKNKGPWLYYTKNGLSSKKSSAYTIQSKSGGLIAYTIDDVLEGGRPLIDNSTPYSFRVMSIDASGVLSAPSYPVTGIVLEDTVPPSPPFNVTYTFVSNDMVRIRWEIKDTDIEKYRVYYGVTRDRWDGVVYTSKTYLDLLVDREALQDRELYVTVTAIDRAGNESGYMPVGEVVTAYSSGSVEKDIVLSSEKIFRDVSQAVRQPPPKKTVVRKKTTQKPKPKKPKKYDAAYLSKKGYSIEAGETAVLTGSLQFPEDAIITVKKGGKLIIEDAQLSPQNRLWGGIRYLSGSTGYIRQVTVSGAATGIAVLDNKGGLSFTDIIIRDCEENGILVKNSTLRIDTARIENNKTGVLVLNGEVKMTNADVTSNEKGILSNNYRLEVLDSRFRYNQSYGVRMYGGGTISNSIFEDNLVGIVLEEGTGRGSVIGCTIEKNRIDGIVVAASNVDIRSNSISANGRHGIYTRGGGNPVIVKNDIVSNKKFAVIGGGKISGCFIAYNNGSIYIDDTPERGKPDNVLSSSSSGVIKQIVDVDYIHTLSFSSVLQ